MQMKVNNNTALKAVGASLAIGSAVAVVSAAMGNNSMKRKTKKTIANAANTFTNFVDNMQSMMK
ncbi:MAG: hypothetical protein RR914_04510 [Oscillospiraceae bacterium]